MARSASSTTTSRPCSASARAQARPTTPAPTTATSTDSMGGRIRFKRNRIVVIGFPFEGEKAHESGALLRRPGHAPPRLLRPHPQAPGGGRPAPHPLAFDEVLRA